MLRKLSFWLGRKVGRYPAIFVFGGFMFLAFCLCGFVNMQITDDPQELWVPAKSRANIEQQYFIDKFGPFFRINTLWLTPGPGEDAQSDIFQKPYLEMLYHLQMSIESGTTKVKDVDYKVQDFCYKPITGKGCIVTSPMEYWRANLTRLQGSDVKKASKCEAEADTTDRVCFDRIGVPVLQFAIFGGLSCVEPRKNECSQCAVKAPGLQVTFLLYNNDFTEATAEAWEKDVFIRNIKSFNKALGNDYHTQLVDGDYNHTLIAAVQNVSNTYKGQGYPMVQLKADYLAERSLVDNIKEETDENTLVAVISYVLMFFYVGCAIGHLPSPVHSKFSLGLAGIFVVLSALGAAIGLTFYANVKLTMISAEVAPFLILAIGVDNMFLISRAERQVPKYVSDLEMRLGLAMQEIGPSIFVAAFCEALAFFIGMQTNIPALQSFCLVAGLAVITNCVFQVCFFLPALGWDRLRINDNRFDICCCCRSSNRAPVRQDYIRNAFNRYFVPFVFRKTTKALVIAISICLCVVGAMSSQKLLRGLNQNVSLVSGSDIYDYFETLYTYGAAGPPAYVIFNNVDYTNKANLDEMKLINAELSALSGTVMSPIYSWVSPFTNFVTASGVWADACGSREAAPLSFDDQMKLFIKVGIDSQCCQKYGICGEQYSLDIVFNDQGKVDTTRFRFQHTPLKSQKDFIDGLIETRRATDLFSKRLTQNQIQDTNADSVSLRKKAENIYNDRDLTLLQKVSLKTRRKLSSWLGSSNENADASLVSDESESPAVYCYSLFYVFYDQYTYITGVLAQDVILGLLAVFISIQFLASIQISFFITICVFLVFFELMGSTWMLNEVFGGYPIEYNAVLVVNLITSLGFGVEFCNHIGMNFMRQRGSNEVRAKRALGEMGASVLVGIAITKFIGVVVLAFANSTIFRLYFFRMFLCIVIFGAFNGLMFLPVMLSLIGPATDKSEVIEEFANEKFLRQLFEDRLAVDNEDRHKGLSQY